MRITDRYDLLLHWLDILDLPLHLRDVLHLLLNLGDVLDLLLLLHLWCSILHLLLDLLKLRCVGLRNELLLLYRGIARPRSKLALRASGTTGLSQRGGSEQDEEGNGKLLHVYLFSGQAILSWIVGDPLPRGQPAPPRR